MYKPVGHKINSSEKYHEVYVICYMPSLKVRQSQETDTTTSCNATLLFYNNRILNACPIFSLSAIMLNKIRRVLL